MTMTQFVDHRGQKVQLGKELGRGGQGAVFEVAGRQDLVAKVYLERPDHSTIQKLTALAQIGTPDLLAVSAWPQSVLKDSSGSVHGFVMPLVSEAEFHELHNLYRITSRRKFFPQADWRFLVHVARNVSRAFAVLHTNGHLMGDVSSRNVMVSEKGIVRFIDTDSFQIKIQNQAFPCPVGTAEFTPPELQGKTFGSLVRTHEHDRFGLALLIFHLLFDGRHPYAGVHDNGATPSPDEAIKGDKFAYSLQHQHGVRPPPFALTLNGLHNSLRDLFERAFAPSHQGRPAAAEWEKALAELSSNLTTCGKNTAHKHDRRLPCPWCAQLPSNAQAATAKTGVPAGAKQIDVEKELNRIWMGVQAIPRPGPPPQLPTGAPGILALPAQPALPTIPAPQPSKTSGFSIASLGWGVLYGFVSLSALLNGSFLAFFFFAVVCWYNLNKNSARNVEAREQQHQALVQAGYQKQLQEARNKQLQAYQGLLQGSLQEHRKEADGLRRKLSEAYARQQANSAENQYKAALSKLEDLRRTVRATDRSEQEKLQEVIERHRRPLLEQHLAKYVIRPGVIPGVGPALIANLNQRGIYTAKDITDNVRWIKGVGPRRQQDLEEWRETLEQFFQFSPSMIPPHEFQRIRDQMDQDRKTKLTQLEGAVAKLRTDVTSWTNMDQAIATDIRNLRNQLLAREKTIEAIEQGMVYRN